jgi:hypothetical protein
MIDGEIYTMIECTRVVFAYRDAGRLRVNPHYIGVNAYGEVKRYGDGYTIGDMGEGATRLANADEIARFKRLLKESDYHWNKANKKVIRISTGELL